MKMNLPLFTLISALLLLTSCAMPSHDMESASRNRLTSSVWMVERQIPTDPFLISVYERVHDHGGIANIYIEGDGLVSLSNRSISRNPTPQYPVALHMATKDRADNVIYMARPCQITGMTDPDEYCHHRYWTKDRYSPQVIESVQQALDELRRRYGFIGFNITAYGGGAALAGMLAKDRDDIKSLRTVSGNIQDISDPQALYDLPQIHYVGVHDNVTPLREYKSYLLDLQSSPCVTHKMVEKAGYEDGWADQWDTLLKQPVLCRNPDALQMPFIYDTDGF